MTNPETKWAITITNSAGTHGYVIEGNDSKSIQDIAENVASFVNGEICNSRPLSNEAIFFLNPQL